MRVCVQRVSHANVVVDQEVVGEIDAGLLLLVGVAGDDTDKDLRYMAEKVVGLRIFPDQDGKMNLSVKDMGGKILAVSQFTLMGDCRKGKRPSFLSAGDPLEANNKYQEFIQLLRGLGMDVETGVFQTDMKVNLCNDGPVTILLDSRKTF